MAGQAKSRAPVTYPQQAWRVSHRVMTTGAKHLGVVTVVVEKKFRPPGFCHQTASACINCVGNVDRMIAPVAWNRQQQIVGGLAGFLLVTAFADCGISIPIDSQGGDWGGRVVALDAGLPTTLAQLGVCKFQATFGRQGVRVVDCRGGNGRADDGQRGQQEQAGNFFERIDPPRRAMIPPWLLLVVINTAISFQSCVKSWKENSRSGRLYPGLMPVSGTLAGTGTGRLGLKGWRSEGVVDHALEDHAGRVDNRPPQFGVVGVESKADGITRNR